MATETWDTSYFKGYDRRWNDNSGNPIPPKNCNKDFLEGWNDADNEIRAERRTPTPE